MNTRGTKPFPADEEVPEEEDAPRGREAVDYMLVEPDTVDYTSETIEAVEEEVVEEILSDMRKSSKNTSARSSTDTGPPVLPTRESVGNVAVNKSADQLVCFQGLIV
jgi:hypothetical protein